MSDKPSFLARLVAAKDMMLGKVPQGKGTVSPFYYGNFVNFSGLPQQRADLNFQKLRDLAETPIPRRCIRYIKSQVSRLDKGVYAKPGVKLTSRQKQQIKALNKMFSQPNPDESWASLCDKIVEDMLVLGWSTLEVKEWPQNPEQPYLIYPIDGASIQIYTDWNGSPSAPRYAQFDMRGNQIDFKNEEILPIKYDTKSSDPFGLSPLAVAADEIEYLLQTMAYANGVTSSGHPHKLLFLGEDADEDFVREARIYFNSEVFGRGQTPVIGGTKQPTSIELGAENDGSLFLQWQNHLISIVAVAFGLDPQKVNLIQGINRSTGDTLDDVTTESTLYPIANTIEDAFNNYFLKRMGLYDVAEFKFKFTTSHTDLKAISVINQINIQDDVWTINEARAMLGYDPLPIDPHTGISMGDYTVSVYRSKYQHLNTVTISESGTPDPLEQKPTEQTGQVNNGVHGASKPKDKNLSEGKELNTNNPSDTRKLERG